MPLPPKAPALILSKSRDQGEATWSYPEGQVVHQATYTCCHCQYIVHVKPKADVSTLGGWCGMCRRPTCTRPECNDGCLPYEKQMEQSEARDRLCRSMGL
jgi:hypothetical protein